jgi:hypothetical protein
MGNLFWPVEFQTRRSARILVGRLFHWTLTAVAICLIGVTVVTSGTLLQDGPSEDSLWRDPAISISLLGSISFIGVFFLGRMLRFVFARE